VLLSGGRFGIGKVLRARARSPLPTSSRASRGPVIRLMVRVIVRNTPARFGSYPDVILFRGRFHFVAIRVRKKGPSVCVSQHQRVS